MKKTRVLIMFSVGNEREYTILNVSDFILLYSINPFGYRMGIKLDKDPLAVLQNNYASKFVNVYIVYDLDACAKVLLRNSAIKNCLFGVTSIVKNSDKKMCKFWAMIIVHHLMLIISRIIFSVI